MKKILIMFFLCIFVHTNNPMISYEKIETQVQLKMFRSINRILQDGYAFKSLGKNQLLLPKITFVKKVHNGCKYAIISQELNKIYTYHMLAKQEQNLGLSKFLRTVKSYTDQNNSQIILLSNYEVIVRNTRKNRRWQIAVDRHGRITRNEEIDWLGQS